MRQGQAESQILRVFCGRILEEGNRLGILRQAVVRHADEDIEALRVGRTGGGSLQALLEFRQGALQVLRLEERQPEIQAQAGDIGIDGQRFSVERHRFLVVFLPGFEQSELRVGLRIGRVGLEIDAPRRLGFGVLALLLQGERGLAIGILGLWGLCAGATARQPPPTPAKL